MCNRRSTDRDVAVNTVRSFYSFSHELLDCSKLKYIDQDHNGYVALPSEISADPTYTLCIRSSMGSGKTTAIKNLFHRYDKNQLKICFILCRVTFASFLHTEFVKILPNLVLYNKTRTNVIDQDQIVIQLESLCRLEMKKVFDFIILDEFESMYGLKGLI